MRKTTLREFAYLLGNVLEGDSDQLVSGIAVDSRLVEPGNVFFALPGAKADGHSYLQEVAVKGAIAAVVEKNYSGEDYGLQLIRVRHVLQSLQSLASAFVKKGHAKIVAITGSVGKTTTKEFTATLLRQKYRVAASPGNSNSQVGIPLAIVNHTAGNEDILVLEMGMTVPGNIANLIKIAPPDIAVITHVALVHAVNFNSMDEIARAKGEILTHPKTQIGILNYETENFHQLLHFGACRKLLFSVKSSCADFSMRIQPDGTMLVSHANETVALGTLPVLGKHNHQNLLAAITVAKNLNMDWEEIINAIPSLKLPERRLQVVEKEGITFVNDSYNASLLSVKAALESLPVPQGNGKKIAVLGEMLELGHFSEQCHREVGEHSLNHVDSVLCLGKETHPIFECWESAKRPAQKFMERADLVKALRQSLQPGDVVLLKGSRSKELWKVLDEL